MSSVQRVLVVDDSPSVLEVTVDALTMLGLEARGATSPEVEGAVRDWVPDVALVDLAMPEPCGIQVVMWLRRTCPRMRIILYSAHPEASEFGRLARATGADAWLEKPWSLDTLYAAVTGKG